MQVHAEGPRLTGATAATWLCLAPVGVCLAAARVPIARLMPELRWFYEHEFPRIRDHVHEAFTVVTLELMATGKAEVWQAALSEVGFADPWPDSSSKANEIRAFTSCW